MESYFLFLPLRKYHIHIQIYNIIKMNSVTTQKVSISLPETDLSFLKTIAKKMGWTLKKQRKTGLDKALEDVENGNVYQAEDVEDLIKQLNS